MVRVDRLGRKCVMVVYLSTRLANLVRHYRSYSTTTLPLPYNHIIQPSLSARHRTSQSLRSSTQPASLTQVFPGRRLHEFLQAIQRAVNV